MPLFCRVAQDWLKMLWGWPFICPRFHDTWETLELLKFVCFHWHHDPISTSSYSNTMATRQHCEGFTWSVALLRQLGSFLFPSYGAWWSHKVKTMMTRFDKMPSWRHYEGQNGHKISTRKLTFAWSFCNFLAGKRFCHRSQSCSQSLRNSSGESRI